MKPRLGEYLMTVAAVVVVVALLALHAYTGPGRTGWTSDPVLRWFELVSVALGLAAVIAQVTRRGPGLAVTLDLITMLVAGVTTILLAIRLATTSDSLAAGAYVGVVAVAALALGAYRAMRVEQGWVPGRDREVEVVVLPGDPPPADAPTSGA